MTAFSSKSKNQNLSIVLSIHHTTQIYNTNEQALFCSWNLVFDGVLVAIVVVDKILSREDSRVASREEFIFICMEMDEWLVRKVE